jgi:hypothetical protein
MSNSDARFTLVAALDLTLFLEREVKERYQTIARVLGAWGQPAAAMFFLRMARLEEDAGRPLLQAGTLGAERAADDGRLQAIEPFGEPGSDDQLLRRSLRAALNLAARAEHCTRVFCLCAHQVVTAPALRGLFSELAEDAALEARCAS